MEWRHTTTLPKRWTWDRLGEELGTAAKYLESAKREWGRKPLVEETVVHDPEGGVYSVTFTLRRR